VYGILKSLGIVLAVSVVAGFGIGWDGEQHLGRAFELRAIFGFLCVFLPGCAFVIVNLSGRKARGIELDELERRQVDGTALPLKRVVLRALAYFSAFCSAGLLIAAFGFFASNHRMFVRLDSDVLMIFVGTAAVLFVASIGTSVAIEREYSRQANQDRSD
jgi:hypothetical protein